MLDIAELIKHITEFINSKDEELSKKVRKSRKDTSDSDDTTEKKKRAPTAYNLFIREQMAKLKEQETADTAKMTVKAKIQFITGLWIQHKAATSDESSDEPQVAKSTPRKSYGCKEGNSCKERWEEKTGIRQRE